MTAGEVVSPGDEGVRQTAGEDAGAPLVVRAATAAPSPCRRAPSTGSAGTRTRTCQSTPPWSPGGTPSWWQPPEQWLIQDLGSTNGTFLGGSHSEPHADHRNGPVSARPPGGRPAADLLGARRRRSRSRRRGLPQAPAPPTRRPRCGPATRWRTGSQPGSPGSSTQAAAHRPSRRQRRGRQGPAGISPPRRATRSRRRPLPAHRHRQAATAPSSTASGSPPRWSPPRPT